MAKILPRIQPAEYKERCAKVQRVMREQKLDMILLYADDRHTYGAAYSRYYCNFAPAFEPVLVLFMPDAMPILLTGPETDGYAAEVGCCADIRVLKEFAAENEDYPFSQPRPLREIVGEAAAQLREIGIGGMELMGARLWDAVRSAFPKANFRAIDNIMEPLRGIKSAAEIEVIRYAYHLANMGMEAALAAVRPGVSEREIAAEAEYVMRKNGAEGTGIDTIVVSGPNTRHILGRTTQRVLREQDLLTITLAPRYEGYHGACARTIFIGAPEERAHAALKACIDAQNLCGKNLLPGNVGSAVENMGRKVMKAAGFEQNFMYSGLHSVGVIEFEPPILGPSSKTVIESNMVISVDIPLFEDAEFGMRVEDGYLITPEGPERLTIAPHLIYK